MRVRVRMRVRIRSGVRVAARRVDAAAAAAHVGAGARGTWAGEREVTETYHAASFTRRYLSIREGRSTVSNINETPTEGE